VDGRYIFIGLPRGLAAVDVLTQEKVAAWEEDSVDIHYVKAYLIGVQVYLVVTIDDMGNYIKLFMKYVIILCIHFIHL
jgi:hypothetical protein